MAYLRRFTAFLGVILVTSLICGSTWSKPVNASFGRSNGLGLPRLGTASALGLTKLSLGLASLPKNSPKKGVARVDNKTALDNLQNFYSDQLSEIGVDLRPGSEHVDDDNPTPTSVNHCNSIVYKTLMKLPDEHRSQLKDLVLFYSPEGRRGLGGGGEIILRCLDVEDAELASVLVHEIGHLVDGGYLAGAENGEFSGFYDFDVPVTKDDKSSLFYKISWRSESFMRSNSGELDFVSLYGMTDPFEDFAETYTYYRLHGPEFRKLAKENYKLWRKYRFMKKYVFAGEEFDTGGDAQNLNLAERDYDSTVLPFKLEMFI